MSKSVVFLSQMGFNGKIPRNHSNMRVEFAQMCALQADHMCLFDLPEVRKLDMYDVAILLIPKTGVDRDRLETMDVVGLSRRIAHKVLFMQEGPCWIFQDMTIPQQLWHYNLLNDVDGILTENVTDIPYFRGINQNVPIIDIPSLMIEDNIQHALEIQKQNKVIIGGNFTRWYGGFDSFVVARHLNADIWAPSMGRKQPQEDLIINHLPYMDWTDWIHKLAEFRYAVHLMPTIAAGTFAMNCGFLGIPCIGYEELDTQRNIHPNLTVAHNNVEKAVEFAQRLANDSDFYLEQSTIARENYKKYHSESYFINHINKFFDTL